MKPIDYVDLHHPESNLIVPEPHVCIDEVSGPKCLKCNAQLAFTNMAAEEIAFMRMCEVNQSAFACPDCDARMIIFPKGEVKHEMVGEALVVHGPSEGFFIALKPG